MKKSHIIIGTLCIFLGLVLMLVAPAVNIELDNMVAYSAVDQLNDDDYGRLGSSYNVDYIKIMLGWTYKLLIYVPFTVFSVYGVDYLSNKR